MPKTPGPSFVGRIKQHASIFPFAGGSHGWRGRGVDDNDKIHQKGAVFGLEMLGEGGMVGGVGVGGNENKMTNLKSS